MNVLCQQNILYLLFNLKREAALVFFLLASTRLSLESLQQTQKFISIGAETSVNGPGPGPAGTWHVTDVAINESI